MPGFLLYLFFVADSIEICHVAQTFAKRTKWPELPNLILSATVSFLLNRTGNHTCDDLLL